MRTTRPPRSIPRSIAQKPGYRRDDEHKRRRETSTRTPRTKTFSKNNHRRDNGDKEKKVIQFHASCADSTPSVSIAKLSL